MHLSFCVTLSLSLSNFEFTQLFNHMITTARVFSAEDLSSSTIATANNGMTELSEIASPKCYWNKSK